MYLEQRDKKKHPKKDKNTKKKQVEKRKRRKEKRKENGIYITEGDQNNIENRKLYVRLRDRVKILQRDKKI